MTQFTITLDDATAQFYRNVANAADLPLSQVLADALFKLAGELSLAAIHKNS